MQTFRPSITVFSKMTDHEKVDIGILLDKCGINYTEEQLEKLEELLKNLGRP